MIEMPETIYLQIENLEIPEAITWCKDRIDDSDVEYVSKAYHEQEMAKRLSRAELVEIITEWSCEHYGTSSITEVLSSELADAIVAGGEV